MDNIIEAQYLISEVDDTRISYKIFDEVDNNLREALALVEESRKNIQFNMKGE